MLDLSNTVVHRTKPDMRMDRLDTPDRFSGFAESASKFRAKELGGISIVAPESVKAQNAILKLREAADACFRAGDSLTFANSNSSASLQKLFSAASAASRVASQQAGTIPLGVACALSAMRLLGTIHSSKIRTCPNCDWLFLDKSKNGSRRWCDMAICGNRAKAAKHYRSKVADLIR